MEKIGHTFVNTVSETSCTNQIAAKQNRAVQYEDRLVFENEGFCGSIFGKVVGVFSWFKNTAVSLFRMVFCCDYSGGVFGGSVLSKPAEAKQLFSELHNFFLEKKDADSSTEKQAFVTEWKDKFNSLPDEVQTRIIKEDMKGWGINKGLKADDLVGYVESSFSLEHERTKSLTFVRELKTVTDIRGNKYYPMSPKEMPTLLARIRDDYDKEVQAAEKAKNS